MLSLAFGLLVTVAGCGSAPSPDPATPTGPTDGPPAPMSAEAPTPPPPATDWTSYSPKDGSFSAQFPGPPEESVEPTDGPTGKIDMHQFAVERQTGSAYMASYTDFPVPAASPDEIKKRLVAIRDAALGSAHATLVDDKEIVVNGVPGREFTSQMAVPEEVVTHTRVFMRGSRLFQFMTLVPKGTNEDADVRRFLDSIALSP